jgi:hypothetical protein
MKCLICNMKYWSQVQLWAGPTGMGVESDPASGLASASTPGSVPDPPGDAPADSSLTPYSAPMRQLPAGLLPPAATPRGDNATSASAQLIPPGSSTPTGSGVSAPDSAPAVASESSAPEPLKDRYGEPERGE